MIQRDRLTSLILLLFCSFFYYQTFGIKTSNIPGLGASFFPRFLLGFIGLLALIMLISTFLPAARAKDRADKAEKKAVKSPLIVWIIFGIFAVYIMTLNILGFIIGSSLFMFIVYLLLTWKTRTVKQHLLSLAGSVLTSFILFIIFEKFLQVYLPKGIF